MFSTFIVSTIMVKLFIVKDLAGSKIDNRVIEVA